MKESNEKRTRKRRKGGTVFYIKETDRWGATNINNNKWKKNKKKCICQNKRRGNRKIRNTKNKNKRPTIFANTRN